jgi:hypothetical protein
MANNLTSVGREAVLNALRGEVVKAYLYGRYEYIVPGESPVVVEYVTPVKDITFTAASTSNNNTSISMVESFVEFDVQIAGFNEDEEIIIQGIILSNSTTNEPTPNTVLLSAPFAQTFSYGSTGKFRLTALNIFST